MSSNKLIAAKLFVKQNLLYLCVERQEYREGQRLKPDSKTLDLRRMLGFAGFSAMALADNLVNDAAIDFTVENAQ